MTSGINTRLYFLFCSADPLSNMAVEFKSPEDAMDFCEKNGERTLEIFDLDYNSFIQVFSLWLWDNVTSYMYNKLGFIHPR